jgi:hypothetical protein
MVSPLLEPCIFQTVLLTSALREADWHESLICPTILTKHWRYVESAVETPDSSSGGTSPPARIAYRDELRELHASVVTG